MKRFASSIAAAACLAVVPATASAAVITFEGQNNTIYTAPIVRLGFELGNPVGFEQHFHEITSTQFGLPNNGTGVMLNDRDTEFYVVTSGGPAPFTLTSVDVASALNNFPAVGLEIRGYLNNILVGTLTVAVLGNGYTTVAGGALGSIDRLIFDGIGGQGGFVLDNLTLDEQVVVPEPVSLLLLGSGLAAAAIRRRRQ